MIMWTCKHCNLLIVPDGITKEALKKAMEDHVKACTKAGVR